MAEERPSPWVQLGILPTEPNQGAEKEDTDPTQLALFEGQPYSFTVTRNDHRDADTFELVYDFENVTIDPRLIRGITAKIFIADIHKLAPGTLDHASFWQGLSPELRKEYCVLIGTADEVNNVLDGDGIRVKIRGRDYSSYFIDAHLPKDVVWTGESFVKVLRDLIDDPARPTSAIRLILKSEKFADFEVLSSTTAKEIADHAAGLFNIIPTNFHRADTSSGSKTTRKKREGETVWAAMQELALEAGFIMYIDRDALVIREPRTLNPTSFDRDKAWTWTRGGNITRWSPMRRLGRQSGINLIVVSWNPITGKPLSSKIEDSGVTIDLGATQVADSSKAAAQSKSKKTTTLYSVRNITNQQHLDDIAAAIFEQLRHFEMETTVETASLYDSRGVGIWNLDYADPAIIDTSPNWVGTILNLEPIAQVKVLTDAGWDQEHASRVLSRLNDLSVPFIVSKVRYDYDTKSDKGFTAEIVMRSRKQIELKVSDMTKEIQLKLEVE